jgi:hypothetical protein
LEDLSAINYRLQGIAEKKPETQETVLVKRIKHRVRSIKERGWIGSRESNRSRGFLVRLPRLRFGSMDYQGLQGVMCKTTASSSTSARSKDKVDGGLAGPSRRRPDGLEVQLKRKTKGGGRGEV